MILLIFIFINLSLVILPQMSNSLYIFTWQFMQGWRYFGDMSTHLEQAQHISYKDWAAAKGNQGKTGPTLNYRSNYGVDAAVSDNCLLATFVNIWYLSERIICVIKIFREHCPESFDIRDVRKEINGEICKTLQVIIVAEWHDRVAPSNKKYNDSFCMNICPLWTCFRNGCPVYWQWKNNNKVWS